MFKSIHRLLSKRSLTLCIITLCADKALASPNEYFGIHVVDDQTGRGIPLVELHTTYKASYYTDSNGYVAFLEPGLQGQDVWFDIRSAGYESPKGPFGTEGKAFKIEPGKSEEIKLHRTNLAERLYRMSGYGIYRDTVLLGKKSPIANGLLNGQVCGSDSIQVAVFKGKYYWFWQDTDRVGFPLGNYNMTGALSAQLPAKVDLDRGFDFTYFVEKPNGFARHMTDVPQKEAHPVWCDGMTVVKDERGDEKMLCKYITANKDMSVHDRGLMLWNEKREIFEVLKTFDRGEMPSPGGQPIRVKDGKETYLYYPSAYVEMRVKATFEAFTDPSQFEVFTCLQPGSAKDRPDFDRKDGKLVWSWRKNAQQVGPKQVDDWVNRKLIKREETPFQLRDADTGKSLIAHGGSIAWNPYLKKWTMIFGQQFGDSSLGELWFAIANSPEGPWREARKVASHAKKNDNNDCYNPIQHDELLRENGKFIFFEGTFVNTFSGNPKQTPYYDYNNIMYRLDVTDSRLKLPEPPPGLTDAKTADGNK